MRSSSRLALIAATLSSLAIATTTVAFADQAYAPPAARHIAPPPVPSHRFAQPPPGVAPVAPIDDGHIVMSLDRASVRAALVERRAQSVAAFRVYQQLGVFPSNVYEPNALNVWRDPDGHFCAAATIIKTSGQDALVDRVADQNNFIRLADVTTGPLMDWILTSGLTQEEIVMIQEPFMPVVQPTPEPAHDVDAKLRAAETARLVKVYARTDAALVAAQARSLDTATDRLMKRPQIAWALLAKT